LAEVDSKVAQVSDLEAILAHTQDDREASEALVNIFAEKLKAAAAEMKELKEELAILENTVCDLEDRLDAAIDEADADDDDGDFAERLSSEEAQTGEELVGAACGRRYTLEQREHTIKLLGKQIMPSQIPSILVQFKVFDLKNAPSVWWAYHMRREMRVAVLVLAAAAAADPAVISTKGASYSRVCAVFRKVSQWRRSRHA
jgi:hypothetical protein